MRMGRASCNEHTVRVHSVLEKILPPKHFIWKVSFPFCWLTCYLPYKLHIPCFWRNKTTLLWLRPAVLMLAGPVMFGGWIHGKSHIPGTHSSISPWLCCKVDWSHSFLQHRIIWPFSLWCSHSTHSIVYRLSCTFLKLSHVKYQIQTSFGKHQGRESRKKINPMTAIHPMTQSLLSASCTDNVSTHKYNRAFFLIISPIRIVSMTFGMEVTIQVAGI